MKRFVLPNSHIHRQVRHFQLEKYGQMNLPILSNVQNQCRIVGLALYSFSY